MTGAWNIVGVLALGALGWFGTSFVGRPLREFFDLRREVIQKSVLYNNVSAAATEFPDGSTEPVEISEGELKRLQEALNAFRDLAARMRAFALNEHLAVWCVKWPLFLNMLRARARVRALWGLSGWRGNEGIGIACPQVRIKADRLAH